MVRLAIHRRMENQKQSRHPRWPYAIGALVLIGGIASYEFRSNERVVTASQAPVNVQPIPVAAPMIAIVASKKAPTNTENYAWLGNNDIDRAIHSSPDLNLAQGQLDFMQSRYNVFQDQLKQLEARLAQKEDVKPGETLITIPPHEEAAKALYAQFETEMVVYLGTDEATTFFNEGGPTIAMLNADFGAQERQILVDKNADIYHIVDKVVYTTLPGLPAGVSNGPVTSTMMSDLRVGTDMLVYRYLAVDFP
jgi:hypothetical protein